MELILWCDITNSNFKRVTGISKKDLKEKNQYEINTPFLEEFKPKNSYFINWLSLSISDIAKYKDADLSDIKKIYFDIISIEEKSVKIKLTIVTGTIEIGDSPKSIMYFCTKHNIPYSSIIRHAEKIPGEYNPRPSGGVEYVVLEKDFLFFIQCKKILKGDKSLKNLFPSQR